MLSSLFVLDLFNLKYQSVLLMRKYPTNPADDLLVWHVCVCVNVKVCVNVCACAICACEWVCVCVYVGAMAKCIWTGMQICVFLEHLPGFFRSRFGDRNEKIGQKFKN